MRRDFTLPEEDIEWLESLPHDFELVRGDGVLRVVIRGWPVPPGFKMGQVDVHVRIEGGYPDAQIDMAYFHPPLQLTTGRVIGALADDPFDGLVWQRWSRHRTPANPWRAGIDNLATHFALVDSWLAREVNPE
jgi:hypothetical protein